MHTIPAVAARQFGVFTTRQAIAAGWSQDALERAVRGGRLRRIYRGAFTLDPAEGADGLTRYDLERDALVRRAAAAALLIPGAVLSHAPAAVVHELPLLTVPASACLTVPPDTRTGHRLIHLHRRPASGPPPSAKLRVVGVARACLDLAVEHGLVQAVVAADAALQLAKMTRADLVAASEAMPPGRAATVSRKLLTLVDGRSESPLESISRFAMIGFEAIPEPQVWIYGPRGQLLGRVDFLWRELGVVGEADGAMKYTARARRRPEPLREEKARQDRLTAHNLVVVRWGWSEARDPAVLREKIRQGFAQARTLRAAGLQPTVTYRSSTA